MSSRHRHSLTYQYVDVSSEEMSDDAICSDLPPKRQKTSMSSTKTENSQKSVRRRGRGPSKQPCLNRNAQMARENREKKKKYVEELEQQVKNFSSQAQHYRRTIHKQNISVRRLEAEVAYLKNILNNQSNITMLLKSLNENLQKNRGRQEQTHSGTFFEDSRMKPENGQVHNGNNNIATKTSRIEPTYGESPFLNSNQENFQLPITPSSIEDNSEIYLQDNLDLLSSLPNSDSISIFDDYGDLADAIKLDFETQPHNFKNEDNYLENSNNLTKTGGICLHVNSDKVSLAFCSSCHMNSLHSDIE